jgi:hypothetical protein
MELAIAIAAFFVIGYIIIIKKYLFGNKPNKEQK